MIVDILYPICVESVRLKCTIIKVQSIIYNVHCNILSNHKLLISDILIKNIIIITNSINRTRKQLPVYRKYTSRILEIIYKYSQSLL